MRGDLPDIRTRRVPSAPRIPKGAGGIGTIRLASEHCAKTVRTLARYSPTRAPALLPSSFVGPSFQPMFEPAIDQAAEPSDSPSNARRTHTPAYIRSFVPRYNSLLGTLCDDCIRWLLPWERREYPGLKVGSEQALAPVSPHTVMSVRRGRRRLMPHIAAVLADMIEYRCEEGLALVAELRKVEAEPSRMTKGFREVKDWGDGIVGDKRNRGKKA